MNDSNLQKRDVVESPFQMGKVTVPTVRFDVSSHLPTDGGEMALDWEVGARAEAVSSTDEHLYANLVFRVAATVSGTTNVVLDLVTIGRFRYVHTQAGYDEDRKKFSRMLYQNGTSYLYGNLRPIVRSLGLDAGIDEFVLPSLNMVQTFGEVPYDENAWDFPKVP